LKPVLLPLFYFSRNIVESYRGQSDPLKQILKRGRRKSYSISVRLSKKPFSPLAVETPLRPGQRFVALSGNRFRVAIDPSAALQSTTSYDREAEW
jgi:hypothetical protein